MRFGESGTQVLTVVNCRDLWTFVPLSADRFRAGSNPVCSSLVFKKDLVLPCISLLQKAGISLETGLNG